MGREMMPGPEPATNAKIPGRPRRWLWAMPWRAVVLGGLAGLAVGVGSEFWRVMLGNNIHAVIRGRVYRSAQLSGAALQDLIETHQIRTVVNLRGYCAPFPWYVEE